MKGYVEGLDQQYRAALRDYLETPDEALLERAYGIGRQALVDGHGVLDMATMHSEALARVLGADASADRARLSGAPQRFFVEALSPFESRIEASVSRTPCSIGSTGCSRIRPSALPTRCTERPRSWWRPCTSRLPPWHPDSLPNTRRRSSPFAGCSIRSRTAFAGYRMNFVRRSSTTWASCRRSSFVADGISQRWGIPVSVRASIDGGLPLIIEDRALSCGPGRSDERRASRAGDAG